MNGISVKKSPDIIIGSSVPITTAFAALLIAKLRRAKFVYEIRDLWPEALVMLGGLKRASFSYIVMKCIERLILRSADLVISALPSVEDYARMSGLKKRSKIIWIPNPVSPPSKYEATNYLARFAGFNVVYIGGFGRFHDIDVILRAAKELTSQNHNDVNIHLFGDGEFFESYKNKAKHDFLINIYFHGRISKDKIWGVQKEANALLASIPDSDIFKYGINLNKITNYMVAGKAILYCGPDLEYNPVRDSNAGLSSAAGDEYALVSNIVKLKSDEYKKKTILFEKNAKAYYKNNFDIALLGKRYRNALLKICNSHTS
jgi:glycosyltransferase involved in cell wall biosynthesis